MSELPKCKACGCTGIHACMGKATPALTQKEKREFFSNLSKAIEKIKRVSNEPKSHGN